jgi:hypothetical protein
MLILKTNQMNITKVFNVLKEDRAAIMSPTRARQIKAEDKNQDNSVPMGFRIWSTRSTRKVGVQWTQPPRDPTTRTSGKEPRRTLNKNRTGHKAERPVHQRVFHLWDAIKIERVVFNFKRMDTKDAGCLKIVGLWPFSIKR